MASTVVLYDSVDSVRLIIGDSKRSIACSKSVLILLSPVLRAMITGGFREGSAETTEIELPEDDPDAFLLILQIGHLKFADLPDDYSIQKIYQLSKVCDKYDIIGPIRPFLEKYLEPHVEDDSIEDDDSGEWLSISWVFGFEELYHLVLDRIVFKCHYSDDQTLRSGEKDIGSILHLGADGKRIFLETCFHSPLISVVWLIYDFTDLIEGFRREKTDAIVLRLREEFDHLCDAPDNCEFYRLGKMTHKLWTLFSFSVKTGEGSDFNSFSMESLLVELRSILGDRLPAHCTNSAMCVQNGVDFDEFLENIIESSVVLPESVEKHLKVQAAK
jgi:hypothetical protein